MSARQTRKTALAESIPALISNAKLQKMYEAMLQCRIVDAHARKFRAGRPGSKGKEAAIVGATIDLLPDDRIITATGTSAVRYAKGAKLGAIFSDLHATETKKKPAAAPSLDFAAQSSIAAGLALADRERNNSGVTMAFFSGNGVVPASWLEGFLFAVAKKLPLLGICGAADVDETQFTSLPFPVIPVDGNDVVAVYRVAFEGLQRVRNNGGPSLIVCKDVPPVTGGTHVLDPLRAMEIYLTGKGLFSKERRLRVIESFEKAVEKAIISAPKGSERKEDGFQDVIAF